MLKHFGTRVIAAAAALCMLLSMAALAAPAGLTQLGTPTNLTWGVWYDSDDQSSTLPGAMSWDRVEPSQNKYQIMIYRQGEAEPIYRTTHTFYSGYTASKFSVYHLIDGVENLESGSYYFTVQALGDDTPLTVKMRIGWDADNLTGVEVAKQLEAGGADLIAVHGRTREQMYIPPIDTAAIAAIKQAVSIPVLANGDVTSADGALTLLKETGCDGVMIGRGALGDPWLFAQVRAALLGEERPPEPTLNQRMAALRAQIYEMCEEKGEWAAMPQARSQAMHYMKGLRGAAALRRYCSMLEHFTDVDRLIDAVYKLQ